MLRGGRRKGAGRKRKFSDDERCEIARAYHGRMQAAAAAAAMARDPELRRRRNIDKRMRDLARRHVLPSSDMPGDESLIRFTPPVSTEIKRLEAEIGVDPYPVRAPTRRAKGWRDRIIAEVAEEFHTTKRMVERCIKEFDFGP